jgi:hypothetical protein
MPQFPDGKRFAFTVIDDTDVATVENVEPIYRLLEQLGMRTTKTVWPFACPEGSPDFDTSQTLEDTEYRDFVSDLRHRGFEIASHGATMESSGRDRTIRGLEKMRNTFGSYPTVHANHARNRENLYWGAARVDQPIVRALYRMILRGPDTYEGHVEGSGYWWGDVAQKRIRYVRNLTFETLDVSEVNPTIPYHDPSRACVNWWFSAADAENCTAFNRLLCVGAQRQLEERGGIAIVATHFGKGFVSNGHVNSTTEQLLISLSRRPGWFVPVGQLLDWLRDSRVGGHIPAAEWRNMQWRWIYDLLARGIRDRARRTARRLIRATGRSAT